MVEPPPATRLVIRIKLIPQAAPPPRRRLSRNLLLLIAGTVAVLLSWLAFNAFRPDPTSPPAVAQRTSNSDSQSSAPLAVRNEEPSVVRDEPEVRQQPDAPPSSINEVIPTVPRSALETIRGTVRVTVRVIVDKQGMVVDATADDRGPSRYFERLAVEASRKWTFTSSSSEEKRTLLVRFNFTRDGATAHASPLP
jgi:TonB family protein